ncbi:MAG TPA: glycoside hydrolase family 57 protein [Nitrospiria bacterium]|jgi:alpha-amylase/alpha-mannosidase (GH57 family)|nr:glycoside hydrolase family 57 protein [Nitrospiria bacterium]
MEPLKIAFLWHHHQPYYKDPLSGEYSLPWVRLHAIKAYYDMAGLLKDFPEIKAGVNLVPSLLKQLQDYEQGTVDQFLERTLKPAEDLETEERRFLLRYFFMANWETMVKPWPRYYELLQRRGLRWDGEGGERMLTQFTPKDYRDLQVLFNLAWFGFKAMEEFPVLQEFRRKGEGFTEEDKAEVIRCQHEVLHRVIPLYRQLESSRQLELTTSPFYHPILPLVYDTDIARRCMPHAPLPDRFQAPEDARAQILRAVEFHAKLFGRKPTGFWPSEGSVCPEIIPLLADAGIRWIATDEEILLNSMPTQSRTEILYRPYLTGSDGREVSIVFRDKDLSNLISFTMGNMDPRAAVDEFFKRFHSIQNAVSDRKGPSLATIILDGENPWENYPDSGRLFLTELYTRLSKSEAFQTVRIMDEIERHPPHQRIHHLYSGSWIHHDFDIWIGSDEENRAWSYLSRTRKALLPLLNDASVPAAQREAAWEAIYAAEGSDWFWWYGDDFSSSNDEEFDRLFRAHLASAFRHLGQEAPEYLSRPIIHLHPYKHVTEPVNFIHPTLDGKRTTYFEWQGAGFYDATRRSTRFGEERLLSAICYGFNLTHCYIRIDPDEGCGPEKRKRYEIHVHFFGGPAEYRWVIHCALEPLRLTVERSPDGIRYEPVGEVNTVVMGTILELAVPFAMLGWKPGERHNFIVEIREQGSVVETYPPNGYLTLEVPDQDFEQLMWSV